MFIHPSQFQNIMLCQWCIKYFLKFERSWKYDKSERSERVAYFCDLENERKYFITTGIYIFIQKVVIKKPNSQFMTTSWIKIKKRHPRKPTGGSKWPPPVNFGEIHVWLHTRIHITHTTCLRYTQIQNWFGKERPHFPSLWNLKFFMLCRQATIDFRDFCTPNKL